MIPLLFLLRFLRNSDAPSASFPPIALSTTDSARLRGVFPCGPLLRGGFFFGFAVARM